MTTADTIKLRLFRFDPTRDETPAYEEHLIPRTPRMRVLDALNHVYEKSDVDLGYRWYCGTKKCGECALTVNGRPMLSCWEPAVDEMTCEPLTNFPVIRDLVVDTAPYEQVIMKLKPLMTRHTPPVFPEKIGHAEMDLTNRLSKCIECNVCTAVIPVKTISTEGIDWDGYAGTAALVRFARFALDPRDETDRKTLAETGGLGELPLLPVLNDICPQGIDIVNDALIPARQKLLGADDDSDTIQPMSTAFVMGEKWSAFVKLTDSHKRTLCATGALDPITIAGIKESYQLKDM